MIVKMIIHRFLDSSDDKEKEKIGVARPEGLPLRCIGALGILCTRDDVKYPGEVSSAPVQPTVHRIIASVH